MPQYLDDNGNPIQAKKQVYLDDNGNPVEQQAVAGTPPPAENQFSAIAPKGVAQNIEQWGSDLAGDIKYGSGHTFIGRLLQKAGAQPAYNGQAPGAADTVLSLPLGAAQAAQGAGQLGQSGKRWEGTKNVIGGVAQASTIPGAFVSPVAPDKVARAAYNNIPNKGKAGELFAQVMEKAQNVPINSEAVGAAAARAKELAMSGGQNPKVIRDFLRRLNDADKGPMTYKEARDFYTNASKLSVDEFNRLTPVMKRQVGEFTAQLGRAISGAAEVVGEGKTYTDAMGKYRKAALIGSAAGKLGDALKNSYKPLAYGAGTAAGAGLVYKLLKPSH